MSNTLALARAEDEMQGRVQSLMQLSFAGFGIAAAPIGWLAEQIGLRQALGMMGAIAAGTTLIFLVLERRARSAAAAASAAHSEPTPHSASPPNSFDATGDPPVRFPGD